MQGRKVRWQQILTIQLVCDQYDTNDPGKTWELLEFPL